MAFKVEALKAYTVPVALKIGDQTLNCRVSPEVYASKEFSAEMNRISSEISRKDSPDDGIKEIMKTDYSDYDFALSSVITEWDVVDENNNPVPVTAEAVSGLWWQAKTALWTLIIETLSPKSLTRSTQPTSSVRKGR